MAQDLHLVGAQLHDRPGCRVFLQDLYTADDIADGLEPAIALARTLPATKSVIRRAVEAVAEVGAIFIPAFVTYALWAATPALAALV